jgi:hypothetical protein
MPTKLSTYTLRFSRKPIPQFRASLRLALKPIPACLLAVTAAVMVGCSDGGTTYNGTEDDYQVVGSTGLRGGKGKKQRLPAPTEPAPTEPAPAPTEPAPSPSEPTPEPEPTPIACSSTGLAATDLAGQCRAAPTTMGALEIGSSSGSSFASLTATQTATSSLRVSWQPLGTDTSGYMVYFGKTAETANVFVSDLSAGRFNPGAPSISYNAARDLGLYAGDSVCFRIYAYDSARALSGKSTVVCART